MKGPGDGFCLFMTGGPSSPLVWWVSVDFRKTHLKEKGEDQWKHSWIDLMTNVKARHTLSPYPESSSWEMAVCPAGFSCPCTKEEWKSCFLTWRIDQNNVACMWTKTAHVLYHFCVAHETQRRVGDFSSGQIEIHSFYLDMEIQPKHTVACCLISCQHKVKAHVLFLWFFFILLLLDYWHINWDPQRSSCTRQRSFNVEISQICGSSTSV